MVTPALAAAWWAGLIPELAALNFFPERAAQIAADIMAGRWRLEQGEPVWLGTRCEPCEGKHRAAAVLQCGIGVPMRVTGWGLRPAAEAAGATERLAVERDDGAPGFAAISQLAAALLRGPV
jgi:hypothetical protein